MNITELERRAESQKKKRKWTYLYSVGVVVEQKHAWSSNFLCLHHSFQVGQKRHVFRHVGSEHEVNDNLPKHDALFFVHIHEDIQLRILQELESHSQMMILQHTFIVVHDCQIRAWNANYTNATIMLENMIACGTVSLYVELKVASLAILSSASVPHT